jgi:hypothetical protein
VLTTAVALLIVTLGVQVGPTPAPSAGAAPATDRYDPTLWRARQDDYLQWATDRGLSEGHVPSLLAFAERAHRDPSFTWDASLPDPGDFTGQFAKLAA